jgi:hypothetical protein
MSQEDSGPGDKLGKRACLEGKPFLPPLEFSSIVILLYLPALIELGLMEDPASGERLENLDQAKRNIDLLDLLKEKTSGNLDDAEEKFLGDVLSQLKMAFLKKADIIKM